jgi:hypothetical protein
MKKGDALQGLVSSRTASVGAAMNGPQCFPARPLVACSSQGTSQRLSSQSGPTRTFAYRIPSRLKAVQHGSESAMRNDPIALR